MSHFTILHPVLTWIQRGMWTKKHNESDFGMSTNTEHQHLCNIKRESWTKLLVIRMQVFKACRLAWEIHLFLKLASTKELRTETVKMSEPDVWFPFKKKYYPMYWKVSLNPIPTEIPAAYLQGLPMNVHGVEQSLMSLYLTSPLNARIIFSRVPPFPT